MKVVGRRKRLPHLVISALEAELGAELAGERSRQRGAAGSDEPERRSEIGSSHVTVVAAAEIGMIGEIESLEEQFQVGALVDVDQFSGPHIPFEERRTTRAVK